MIIHIDMDAFYVSVETRENPALAGLPVIVGGAANSRGVVAAANYEARKYGVHSAMPVSQAQRLCAELVCLPVNMPLYMKVSRQIHEIFNRYTPEIEPISLDEAFLDVSKSQKLFGSASEIALSIKNDIKRELNIVASAGVAPNKFVAKIASDIEKPDGFVVVQDNEVQAFLDPLPVKRIWGVGKKTEPQLYKYGITTIAELRAQSLPWLVDRFGKLGDHMYRLAHGQDKRDVASDVKAKSISAETTFTIDLTDKDTMLAYLSFLTEQVASRLREKNKKAKTVSIKLRFYDFDTISRSKSLPGNTNQTSDIWEAVKGLLLAEIETLKKPVRLLGVGASGFQGNQQGQGDLFCDTRKNHELDEVTDEINIKFGKFKIHRGRKITKQVQSKKL